LKDNKEPIKIQKVNLGGLRVKALTAAKLKCHEGSL
jgi:hypothetical protein